MLPHRFRLVSLAATLFVAAACGSVSDSGPQAGTATGIEFDTPQPAAGDTAGAVGDMPVGGADQVVSPPAAGAGAAESADPAAEPGAVVVNGVELADPTTRTVAALDPPLTPVGTSDGPDTQRAQLRLLELGFWVQESSGD